MSAIHALAATIADMFAAAGIARNVALRVLNEDPAQLIALAEGLDRGKQNLAIGIGMLAGDRIAFCCGPRRKVEKYVAGQLPVHTAIVSMAEAAAAVRKEHGDIKFTPTEAELEHIVRVMMVAERMKAARLAERRALN